LPGATKPLSGYIKAIYGNLENLNRTPDDFKEHLVIKVATRTCFLWTVEWTSSRGRKKLPKMETRVCEEACD
jgi:hypothetical protein